MSRNEKKFKFFVNIINKNINRAFNLVKKLTKNRFNSTYFADIITTSINRLIRNEFIPDPKERLYIEVSNICNLRCKFCGYSKSTAKKSIMSNKVFFNIINKATDFGYVRFGLTPITGEIFADNKIIEKLEFLENHPKVKNYRFCTNFTLVNKDIIDWLIKAKKLKELCISIYGHDTDSFIEFTGGNKKIHNELISNLNYLFKRCENQNFILTFRLRTYHSFKYLENCNNDLCQILKALIRKFKSKLQILKKYNTWGGYITQDDVNGLDIIVGNAEKIFKNGACSLIFYKNQVIVNGILNACACRDVNATLRIGNLKTQTFKEIYSIKNKDYMNIIKNQQKSKFSPICKNCDFYRSIYKDYKVYKPYEQKLITLKNFYQILTKD